MLSEEFGLHPLAVEDAVQEHQRPKLDRYQSHLFLNAYGARLDTGSGELATSELAAFVTPRAPIQGNRLNVITKKVTSWAAIIAVPTFVTGFYGMNVPYPGFSRQVGFASSLGVMVVAAFVLYLVFKRKDWL